MESPLTWIGDGELYEELSADYIDQEQDFLYCVEDRGHGQWRFDDLGYLPVQQHLNSLYSDGSTDDTGKAAPATSDEAEGPVTSEFRMALDFAACAEDSGLRDGTEEAWARMRVERLIDHETEVYAWEQQVEEYLANAQAYLAGE